MEGDKGDPFDSIESSRRSFIKKMVAAAFVAPVIGSFGLEELAAATGSDHSHGGSRQVFPNQFVPNQTEPTGHGGPRDTVPPGEGEDDDDNDADDTTPF